jgi:acetylornithine deacetylase
MKLTGPCDLLRELVAIPSPSGSEGPIADFVCALLTERGIHVERLEHTVLARVGSGRGPRLLLNSHLDTVGVGQNWTRDPYAAVWEEQRLYGRGANDAKASAAAMLWTMLELAGDATQIGGEVWLALTAQEETTNAGMGAALARLGPPPGAIAGAIDGAITGEPTGLEVVRAQSGLAVLVAEWTGRSCHAAHVGRVEHENALLLAARELAASAPYLALPEIHPLLGKSTLVATILRSGERHNVVPDRAEAIFDGRLAPPYGAADALALLQARMPRARITARSERLRPIETPEEHPFVQAALRAAERARAVGSSTLSDMALLQGVPAVKCGPGESARSHTADEFVLRAEVEAGARFYRRFVPAALEALASPRRKATVQA